MRGCNLRKRILFIAVVLALVLSSVMPMTALAAKPVPFEAIGGITFITNGDVMPAGDSGRWRVIERAIYGSFGSGWDIDGDFTLTYKANVELATQAGNLHGTLEAGSYVAKVNGTIEPLVWLGDPFASPALLTINGHWTFIEGARGQGNFEAWAIVILNEYGHVIYIPNSSFSMTGKWQP